MSGEITQELIEYLQGLSKIGDKVEGTNHYKVVVPSGMSLESIEGMNTYRNRFRGDMNTKHVESFADYVTKFNKSDKPASCFIRSTSPKAKVIFDIGTEENPEHCVHQAMLELIKTADYERVLDINHKSLTQQGLAEFMEDYTDNLTATDAEGNTMDMVKAVKAVRSITFDATSKSEHEVNQLSTTQSALEKIAASSKGEPLPVWLNFTCIPYHGLKSREFPLRVSLGLDKREGVRLTLKVTDLEGIQEIIQEEFMEVVTAAIPDEVETYIGTFSS